MTQLDGIDTSHYQTLTGQAFPPLKFATHKASEGTGIDKTFQSFIASYRAGGVPMTGGYCFVAPGTPAVTQFATFQKQCRSVGGCDIYQLDWEATKRGAISWYPDLATVVELEDRCLQAWGDKVVMYSAPWVLHFAEWHALPNRAPLWLADYSSAGPTKARLLGAVLLQYTSSVVLPAFTGRVDGNTITDPVAWARITGAHIPDVPTPAPLPVDPPHFTGDDDMPLTLHVRAADASRPEALVVIDGNGRTLIKADQFGQQAWANLLHGSNAATVDVDNGAQFDAITVGP